MFCKLICYFVTRFTTFLWLTHFFLRNFVVSLYALFPPIFLSWKVVSANFSAFWMYDHFNSGPTGVKYLWHVWNNVPLLLIFQWNINKSGMIDIRFGKPNLLYISSGLTRAPSELIKKRESQQESLKHPGKSVWKTFIFWLQQRQNGGQRDVLVFTCTCLVNISKKPVQIMSLFQG